MSEQAATGRASDALAAPPRRVGEHKILGRLADAQQVFPHQVLVLVEEVYGVVAHITGVMLDNEVIHLFPLLAGRSKCLCPLRFCPLFPRNVRSVSLPSTGSRHWHPSSSGFQVVSASDLSCPRAGLT